MIWCGVSSGDKKNVIKYIVAMEAQLYKDIKSLNCTV